MTTTALGCATLMLTTPSGALVCGTCGLQVGTTYSSHDLPVHRCAACFLSEHAVRHYGRECAQ